MNPKVQVPQFTFSGAIAYLIVTLPTEWFHLVEPPSTTVMAWTVGAIAVVIGGIISKTFNKTETENAEPEKPGA